MPEASTLETVGPVYRERLERCAEAPEHTAQLADEADRVRVTTCLDGVRVTAQIEPANHIVLAASHSGVKRGSVPFGLAEALCALAVGRPILEVGDHAAIYVEYLLRDRSQPRPVPGIVTPDNADPAFQLPKRLARGLLSAYRAATGYDELANFFERPAGPEWQSLSASNKRERVSTALTGIADDIGLSDADLALLGVGDDGRVIVDLAGALRSSEKGHLLRRIEEQLKQRVETTLHIYSIERKDLNKIRRL